MDHHHHHMHVRTPSNHWYQLPFPGSTRDSSSSPELSSGSPSPSSTHSSSPGLSPGSIYTLEPDRSIARYSDVKGEARIQGYKGVTLAPIDFNRSGSRESLPKVRQPEREVDLNRHHQSYPHSFEDDESIRDWLAQGEESSIYDHGRRECSDSPPWRDYSPPGGIITVREIGMDMLNSPLSSSLVEDEMVWTRPSSPESRYSQFKNQFKKYPVKFWARHISPENLLKPRNRSDFPTLVYSLVTPHFTFEEIFDMFPGPGPRPCNITGTPDVEKEEYSRDSPEFVAEEDRNVHEEDNTFTDDPEALAFYKSYEKHIAAITTRPTDQLPLGICVGEISSNTRFDIIPAPDHIHGGWQWKDSPHVLSFKNMLADEPRVPYPARSSRWRANASGGLDIPPPEEYEEEVYGPFEILNSFLDELIPRHEATPSDGFKDPSWIIKFIIFPNPSDGFRSEYDAEDWYNLTRGRVLPERFRRDFPSKQHWSDEEWYPAISLGVSQEAIDIQPGIILRISEFCKVFEVSMVCLPLLRPRKME